MGPLNVTIIRGLQKASILLKKRKSSLILAPRVHFQLIPKAKMNIATFFLRNEI